MNDSTHGQVFIVEPESPRAKSLRWKLNLILFILIFVIIGLFGLLGSMNQLYKKLNYLENFCKYAIEYSEPTKKEAEQP